MNEVTPGLWMQVTPCYSIHIRCWKDKKM